MNRKIVVSVLVLTTLTANAKLPFCDEFSEQPETIVKELRDLPAYAPYRNILKDERLKTSLDDHQLAISPRELIDGLDGAKRHPDLNIDMPMYFLGMEKIGRRKILDDGAPSCQGRGIDMENMRALTWSDVKPKVAKKAREAVCQVLNDPKPMLLTHIVRSSGISSGVYAEPCNIFSVYGGRPACAGFTGAIESSAYNYGSAVSAALSIRTDIEKVISERKPTHILMMSTGWNTQQDESMYNYLDWLDSIKKSAKVENVDFRPLVIAFTWRSEWTGWRREMGVVNKGNDADEIGMTWANTVLNDVALPISSSNNIPLVLIGHSYGTRVLGSALFSRNVFVRDIDLANSSQSKIAFLALQAAFPVQRFTEEGKEPIYLGATSLPILMVMTSSPHDQATSKLDGKFGIYVGGGGATRAFDEKNLFPPFLRSRVDASGKFESALPKQGFVVADASEIVNCTMPNTGGDAHSDVFDDEMGNLIWSAIKAVSVP